MKTGIKLIVKERKEQINKHNFSIEHDAEFNELRGNDGLYPLSTAARAVLIGNDGEFPSSWNDLDLVQKMCDKSYKDRLIIAGALIAAELDRLLYEEANKK